MQTILRPLSFSIVRSAEFAHQGPRGFELHRPCARDPTRLFPAVGLGDDFRSGCAVAGPRFPGRYGLLTSRFAALHRAVREDQVFEESTPAMPFARG